MLAQILRWTIPLNVFHDIHINTDLIQQNLLGKARPQTNSIANNKNSQTVCGPLKTYSASNSGLQHSYFQFGGLVHCDMAYSSCQNFIQC